MHDLYMLLVRISYDSPFISRIYNTYYLYPYHKTTFDL